MPVAARSGTLSASEKISVPSPKPAAAVLSSALSVMDANERSRRLRALAAEVTAKSPTAAWALQPQIAGTNDRTEFCQEILATWSKDHPREALEAAAALPTGSLRTACLATALEGLARQDLGSALDYAAHQLSGSARESALTAIVGTWAALDPPAASTWAVQHLSNPGASGTLRAAVASWADTNPAAAGQWVAGLPPGDSANAALSALVETWAEQTPAETAAWLSSQGISSLTDGPSEALAIQWAASDPRAAAEWAINLPRTMTARTAAAHAVGEWAAASPEEAVAWLAAKAPEIPRLAPALYQSLAAGWAGQDAPASATWVDTLMDPSFQNQSAQSVFNIWAATDSHGLASWIGQHPASAIADSAREQLALSRSDTAPAEALAVALQLSTPQAASGLASRIFSDWQSRDRPAAGQWAGANPSVVQSFQP